MCESDDNAPLFAPRAAVVGTTGTGLDGWVGLIVADPGLNHSISLDDIAGGATAANALNQLIIDGIRATGVANDGSLNAADLYDINRWIQADPGRFAGFVALHGDDEWTEAGELEWGFHLVQNDGATSRLYDENAVNTVLDGSYHIGFDICDGRFLNEDGDANQDLEDVAYWLSDTLKADLAAGSLANALVNPYAVGSTGTGLDAVIDIIRTDIGLNRTIATFEITEGARAADALNAMILEAITSQGLANDGALTASDLYDVNAWFRADADRYARFVELHGDDEWTEAGELEWGFHLVQNDGAEMRLFGDDNAVNTVFDGLYHIGFEICDDRFVNEDGNANASVEDVAHWLGQLLSADLAAGDLVNADVDPFAEVISTGTGLDLLVETIIADEGLNLAIATSEIAAGAAAASRLNVLLLDGINATGAANDGVISTLDLRAINAWVQADAGRYARFVDLHGDDECDDTGCSEWGFHLVQNDGDSSYLFDQPAVDTVADGLYHVGFNISGSYFLNEDGNSNRSLDTAARWLNALLATDLNNGSLVNPAFIADTGTLDALAAEAVLQRRADAFNGVDSYVNLGHTPDLALSNGTIAFQFSLNAPAGWQTLFSKDASGSAQPGHLTAWASADGVKVRLQDVSQELYLQTESFDLEAGVAYDFAFSFGDGGAALYIDGTLVDADPAFQVDLAGNTETLVLGASTTTRTAGQLNNLKDFLDGSIDGFTVFDRALSPLEIQYLENTPDDYAMPNADPVAGADGPVYVVAGGSVVVPVAVLLGNDTDKNGDAIHFDRFTAVTGGVARRSVVDGVDSVVFSVLDDASGEAAIGYAIADDSGGSDTAELRVHVLDPNAFAADLILAPAAMTFTGTGTDVVNIAHQAAFAATAATYAFTYRADGAGALFSKDARGYVNGGHLTAWVDDDGSIEVRYQSTSESIYLESAPGQVDPGAPTHFAFTFDDDSASLFLNGEEVDSVDLSGAAAFAAGMTGNTESLVIGASAASRTSGQLNNLAEFLSGEIEDFVVLDRALDEGDVAMLQAIAIADDDPTPALALAVPGPVVVNDRVVRAVEIDHTDDLALAEGTVAFRFRVDSLDAIDVLLSKDASGRGDGGHTSIFVKSNGSLNVLFQGTSRDVVLTAPQAVTAAGDSHHVAFTFGDGDARLYLDGREVDVAEGCDTDWLGNGLDLVIGAGSHGRTAANPDRLTSPFDGAIEDVVIFDRALGVDDISGLAGGDSSLFV